MLGEFDLLGDLIPTNHGEKGRPGHRVTPENINKVRQLVIAKKSARDIGKELGVSGPTVSKHYFKLKTLREVRLRFLIEDRARTLLMLDKAAMAGNVAAIKEKFKIIEKELLNFVKDDFVSAGFKPKAKKLGKKAQRLVDAEGHDDNWGMLPQHSGAKH